MNARSFHGKFSPTYSRKYGTKDLNMYGSLLLQVRLSSQQKTWLRQDIGKALVALILDKNLYKKSGGSSAFLSHRGPQEHCESSYRIYQKRVKTR
ncbi:hypothetical protein PMI08_02169 [Brevibacillus sp. CF112]|nr:hypothetical protein PMI08_02169 [Brevibacillus sp. CF112]